MSRFFEVLSETVRSDRKEEDKHTSRGVPGPVQWEGNRLTLPDIAEGLSSEVGMESPELRREERIFSCSDAAEGIPSTKTAVHLSPKARLIPQALNSAIMEHYRRLRTKVLQQQKIKPFRSLLVTSPNPQEGKTVTVLNLGLSFAMLPGFKVLVLDGDLRKSTFAKILGVHGHPGFSNLIDGSAQMEDVILKSDDFPLQFVLSGTSQTSPGELLQSDEVRKQVRRLSEEFSLILVDSPPLNLLTDTHLLAGCCDAVLLIARAFRSKQGSLEKAVQDLAAFRVIGTVLNGRASADLYRGGYKYYSKQ